MKIFTSTANAVILLCIMFSLIPIISTYAQEQKATLSGVVKDKDGIPIPGVIVWQDGTNIGTETNDKGFYVLDIIPSIPISFEYFGYEIQTHHFRGVVLNITLFPDENQLEELVINAGYYSVTDQERTGSISKITSEDIAHQPVANPLAAMQGRMAGVDITQSSGTPGGGYDIKIRGVNSLRADGNDPLYIVDGVPFLSDSQSNRDIAASILRNTKNSPLQQININDIESIEVLKDADATAIYGSRGANGVILITTKKGMNQKTKVTFSSSVALGTVPKFMELLSTPDYIELRLKGMENDGLSEIPANAYDVNGVWDKSRETNWQKELIGNTAINYQTSLGVRGGDEYNQFFAQASVAKDGTVFPGDYGNKRNNLLMNFTHYFPNKSWSVHAQFLRGEFNNILLGTDLTREAMTLAPNAPSLYTEDGMLNWENGTWENPLRWANRTYQMKGTNWMTSVTVKGNLTNNLELVLNAGLNESISEEYMLTPHTIYNPNWGLDSSSSSSLYSSSKGLKWNIEPQLNFTKKIENHQFKALAGLTFLKQETVQQGFYASNFSSNSQLSNLSAARILQVINNSDQQYAYQAIFARLNYQYNSKYILNLTGRRDGSSRFGSNNRWANFGALGAAWIFSHEKWFDSNKWLSFGKLRASYGITGSDRIGDYQYLDMYAYSGGNYLVGGMYPIRLHNPNFSWESNLKQEIALETAFFDNRVSLTINHYQNKSSNQLIGVPLPGTTGFSSIQANLPATVKNSGWEIETNINLLRSQLKWEVGGNISFNKNELINFPDLESSTYANQYSIGYPTSIIKAYEYTGFDEENGVYTFKDFNEDGIISPTDDRKKIIDLTPEYTFGIYQNFSFKNWHLSMLFQGAKQLGHNYLLEWPMYGSISNQPNESLDAGMHISAGYDNEFTESYYQFVQSDQAYSDASYIRLKNIHLSYTFQDYGKKWDLTTFISGQNIITWTKYKGLDPESQSIGVVPPLKVWSFGFQITY